jgi:CheY-like chemotaxis protein
MTIFGKCPFYRECKNPTIGIGLGQCDLGDQAICEGDMEYCDKPDDLKKQLLEQKRDAGNGEKEKDRKKLSSYTVLVVDDQDAVGRLVSVLLSRLGHRCTLALSGSEALGKAIHTTFDAVVTDIVMPGMDGICLTKELLTLYPRLPVMVMTAHSKDYSTESALMAGARDFITKPFTVDEFVFRFRKMMRDHTLLTRMESRQKEMTLAKPPS